MQIDGKAQRTIWYDGDQRRVGIIDQTLLPHEFKQVWLSDLDGACDAIYSMQVRGAPLIGAAAAYGLVLALFEDPSPENEHLAVQKLLATRPTAVNLRWALQRMQRSIKDLRGSERVAQALLCAQTLCDEDVETCSAIGDQGLGIIKQLRQEKQQNQTHLNILTHCNAGWLATVDWGTAIAPIYKAHNEGIAVHVWVDETRPRNQGASLTAWELGHHGVPHTVIADNTGGHLMQQGLVDLCLVGSDRTAANGDVCNKIGTYLKALAAKDNQVPFYVALPVSTIDWQINDGVSDIPIELRDPSEVTEIWGKTPDGSLQPVQITPSGSQAVNYAFDITPARLVTALITEKGIFEASPEGLASLKVLISDDLVAK